MKTKNFFLALTLGAVSLGFTACNNDNPSSDNSTTEVTVNTLPEKAQTLLKTLNGSVTQTNRFATTNAYGSDYETYITTNVNGKVVVVKIEFDINGNWTEAESKTDNVGIPHYILSSLYGFPANIMTYLNNNNIRNSVEEIERKAYGFKLSLLDDTELLFDREGVLLNNNKNNPEQPAPAEDNNATAKAFIEKHFAGYNVVQVYSEYDDGVLEHKYYIQNGRKGYKIVFNEKYDWTEVEGDEDRAFYLPQSIIQVLPAGIQNYLAKTPRVSVVDIEKSTRGYKLELSNDLEAYFDLAGNFLRIDD